MKQAGLVPGLASSAAVTFIPVLHEKGQPGTPFLYIDWKKCARAVCYPLPCFSLGSFAMPPGKREYLENFHPGSLHHSSVGSQLTGLVRLSYNRKPDFCC